MPWGSGSMQRSEGESPKIETTDKVSNPPFEPVYPNGKEPIERPEVNRFGFGKESDLNSRSGEIKENLQSDVTEILNKEQE